MARLIYTDSSNQERSIYLGPDQPVVKIGRASDCEIRTSRQSVSRNHAEFRYVDGTFEVTDMNSSNGTWLIEDDQRFEISHERLEDGDEIWCGDFVLHFTLSDAVGAESGAAPSYGHPSGQYVSGPSESAHAFGAVSGGHASHQLEPPMPSQSGPYSSQPLAQVEPEVDSYEYHNLDDLSGVEHEEMVSLSELERMREEKESIEDLASRQTIQIAELEGKLEELGQQLAEQSGAAEQAESLRAEAERLRREKKALEAKLEDAAAPAEESEALRAELSSARDALAAAKAQVSDLKADYAARKREHSAAKDAHAGLEVELRMLQAEHDARGDQLGEARAQLKEAARVERALREELASAQDASGEDAREELERSERLLTEYERRNADLRIELDAQRDANGALRDAVGELRGEVAKLREELDQAAQRLQSAEPAQDELEGAKEALEEALAQVEDLESEVQGLKQRVQLERRRNKELEESDAQEVLRAELDAAEAKIDALQAQLEAAQLAEGSGEEPAGAQPAIDAEFSQTLRDRLSVLERFADAIVRADLEPLSTVDRVRLQSAIRETDPKETLREALEMLE